MSMTPGPVIVVDDDAAVRQSLKFALELEGLDVRLYEGADEILAESELPESGCLVVDYYMPRMNGVELIDRLRRRLVKLPAILITARATDDMRRRAARSGFRQVIEKPLEDGTLVDSIRGALAASI
ncbi:response regulator transcription factor [Microvirga sp. 2YAF29]|uniref:response regulator transcription factor n=1 Tax=Microvirga sp. 2YAF29 TaxID=3233031 RepID=UPI003F94E74D